MINFIANIITFFILIIIIYKYYENYNRDVSFVKSSVNGKEYLVRNEADKDKAADLLARLAINLTKLVDYIAKSDVDKMYKEYVKEEDTNLDKFRDDIKRLIGNFNPDNISESSKGGNYTSYSVNKGEKIIFCIRSKKTNKLINDNTILFVGIHELGHLMTKSIGHTPEFWDNFRILLRIAVDNEIYKYEDFDSNPVEYCGTKITNTPYKRK